MILILLGIVLLQLWMQLDKREGFSSPRLWSSGVDLDLGQRKQAPDMGDANNLTTDDITWAREQGATTDDEVQDLIAQHKQEFGQ